MSSWGHLASGDMRPVRVELSEPNLPTALSGFVRAQPLGTATWGVGGTCRIYTALIFHPTKNYRSHGKAAFPWDFPLNLACPGGLQSTQQALVCVG